MKYLTTEAAAAAAGVTVRRVRVLCERGTIRATKHGRDWMVDGASLHAWMSGRRNGRPPGKPSARKGSAI